MSGLKQQLAATSGELARADSLSVAEQFESVFGIKVGGYLEIQTKYDPGRWQLARVLGVDQLFKHPADLQKYEWEDARWVANIKLARRLRTGGVGTGRSLLLLMQDDGTLHPWGSSTVKAVRKEEFF